MTAEFLAVDADGSCVGLVGALRFEDNLDVAELVAMWVDPAARRIGLAAKLIDAVVRWCNSVGIGTVELWVTPGNDSAARFYQRYGFVATEPRAGSHQYDECALFMTMDIIEAAAAANGVG